MADILLKIKKPLKELAGIFPSLVSGLIFLVKTLPKSIITVSKTAFKFGKKSVPLFLAVIISYITIFLGIQIFLKKVTDTPDLVPHLVIVVLSLYIVYNMVMENEGLLRIIQIYIYNFSVLVFGNSFTRKIYKFKLTEKDQPTFKNIVKLSVWMVSNPIQFIMTIYIIYSVIYMSIKNAYDTTSTLVVGN
jgi:hypothetical protein